MRILFITSFYPPYVVGGWEQNVEDINLILRQRGHVSGVLTSYYGAERPVRDGDIHRVLHLESDVQHYYPGRQLSHHLRLRQNLERTKDIIREFCPDVVFVFGMWNLTLGVPWVAEQMMPGRVVYYIAGDWPYVPDPHTAYWREPARRPIPTLIKRLMAPLPLALSKREQRRFSLRFEHVICVSQAVKEFLACKAGIPKAHMTVIHNGIEVDQYYPLVNRENSHSTLSILYAGTVAHHKGVHTAIEALIDLRDKGIQPLPSLTIVGSGHDEYETSLRYQVHANGLEDSVKLRGRVPRSEMPELMRQFDILVLPSIWEEPLARVMQEAMASGLTVIGTNTGGTGELLVDGETGLVFPPGDGVALARCIERLIREPELGRRLAANGRQQILEHFTLDRMVDESEKYLHCVVSG